MSAAQPQPASPARRPDGTVAPSAAHVPAHPFTKDHPGPAIGAPATPATKFLGVFQLAMLTVVVVASLRSLPAMAGYGLSSVVLFVVPALLFLLPTALVAAELATGWKGGVFVWVSEAFGRKWGFQAIWLQWIQNVVWYPTQIAFIAASLSFVIMQTGLASSGLFTAINLAFQSFFEAFGMPWGTPVISLLIALGAFASVVTWIAGPSRGLLAAARDRRLRGRIPLQLHSARRADGRAALVVSGARRRGRGRPGLPAAAVLPVPATLVGSAHRIGTGGHLRFRKVNFACRRWKHLAFHRPDEPRGCDSSSNPAEPPEVHTRRQAQSRPRRD